MIADETRNALASVRDILHEIGWTKRCYARGADGVTGTNVIDPNASCFCVQGAVQRVCAGNDMLYYHVMDAIHVELAKRKFPGSVQLFNDEAPDLIDVLLMLTAAGSR